MGPPPRPPIICYDLHTNTNGRRKTTNQTSTITTTTGLRPLGSCVRYNYGYENQILKNDSHTINSCSRYAYDQKLKENMQEKQLRVEYKKRQLAMQQQLEAITEKLESLKKIQENFLKTYGMGHSNAKYIQQQDEEYARLKQKIYQYSETRSKELGRRIQHMTLLHDLQERQRLQKQKEEEELRREKEKRQVKHKKVLRDVTKFNDSNYCKHTLNSTLNNSLSSASSSTSNSRSESSAAISPSTFSLTSTCSSSAQSTISSSSSSTCSPSMSKRYQHVPCSVRFAEPPSTTNISKMPPTKPLSSSIKKQHKKLPTSGYLSSSTPSKNPQTTTNTTYNSCVSETTDLQELAKKYSFYKKDSKDDVTIEVNDDEFFEMVEDKTMLEVKELFNEMNEALTNIRCMSN